MSNRPTDISQIRKYLNGELDARAMHQLEREAQHDPFLADALQGYEDATGLQQRQLNDLEGLLQQRIDQRKTRHMPWMYISAAASLILILTIAYLLWPSGQKAPVQQTAALKQSAAPPPVDHPASAIKADTTGIAPVQKGHLLASNNTQVKIFKPAPQAVIKAADQPAANAGNDKGIEPEASDAKVATESALAKVEAPIKQGYNGATDSPIVLKEVAINGLAKLSQKDVDTKPATAQVLQGRVKGVQVTTPEHYVNGVVLDQMGVPLPGVSVLVLGTNRAAQTDANGKFTVPITGDDATLDIKYIGFNPQQVKAKADDQLKIALKENTQALAEVVVTGYGAAKRIKPVKEAHPQMGWDNYNKYLKREAIADDEKTGTVQLSFTVDGQGRLSNFKILKGLSDGTNQQAIDLVKDGPAWAPDASGQPKTVKLKIRFSKE